jgi:superfamily II DNA or RNA helicase
MFNNKKIKHITSVNMLNEGCNLTDCRIGIFVSINSSEILVKQKNGRLLRHKEPIIIIPYYINTREEELVKQMLENYNPELVSTMTKFEDIVL